MTIIICDAGPVIHLQEAGYLDMLKTIGSISITKAVYQKIVANVEINNEWPKWIKITTLSNAKRKEAEILTKVADLHKGEAESFILAKQIDADMLLTDDTAARFYAKLINLEAHGSLGVIIWNVSNGYMTKSEGIKAIEALSHSSLWISDKILQEAITAINSLKE